MRFFVIFLPGDGENGGSLTLDSSFEYPRGLNSFLKGVLKTFLLAIAL